VSVRHCTWQDVAKPDSARLRRNMSALVNLAKFREEKLAGYVEGQRMAEELQQRIWELEDQKQAMVRRCAVLAATLMTVVSEGPSTETASAMQSCSGSQVCCAVPCLQNAA
jgi:hypothetical protein